MMGNELSRFLRAQKTDYPLALAEIRSGKKRSHWMWYIFPQLKRLGRSSMSKYYGIKDLDEAKAYLADPILCKRLIEICEALLSLKTNDVTAVMDDPDDKKLRSSMTLFDAATDSLDIFSRVLDKFYGGKKDHRTLEILGLV